MGFPDRIERTMELAHPPRKRCGAALTTAEGLAAWFGEEADIDLRPGGAARMKWAQRVLGRDAGGNGWRSRRCFGFTWQIEELPDDDPRPHLRRVSRSSRPAPGTRLTVVETGFAQLPEGRLPQDLRRPCAGLGE